MAKWKEFEVLLAELQQQTAPDAHVQHNQRIKGRSGRVRQLDITISQKVGLYPVLIVIECKRYRRLVGIEKVESFVTKLRDVGASHGVMISNTSFDAGAKAIAKDNMVTLLSYREATNLDWQKVFGSEAWLSLVVTQPDNVSVALIDEQQQVISPHSSDGSLYDVDGKIVITPTDLYRLLEDNFAVSSDIGDFEGQIMPGQSVYARTDSGLQRILAVVIRGTVKGQQHIVNLSLASGHVLQNAETQKMVLSQVASTSIDKEALLKQPGREITKEEFDGLKQQSGLSTVSLNLSKVKRYLRIVAIKKDNQ